MTFIFDLARPITGALCNGRADGVAVTSFVS